MKQDYLVIFLTIAEEFVDEKIFSATCIKDVEKMAEKYMDENKYLWIDRYDEEMFFFWRIEESEVDYV